MSLVFTAIIKILTFVGMVGTFGILIFVPWGFVKLAKSRKEIDADVKNKKYQTGVLLISLPFILIFGSFILFTIIQKIQKSFFQ